MTAKNGLASSTVFAIDFDKNNNAWIGTEKGLQFLKDSGDSIYSFTMDQGLAANDIYEVALHDSKVYSGSSKGINILKDRNLTGTGDTLWDIKTVNANQGLNYLDVAQGSMSFDNNNRLWAGVENQILTVIDEINQDTTALKTYITGINITDERKEFRDGSFLKNKRQGFDSIWDSKRDSYIVIENQDSVESTE